MVKQFVTKVLIFSAELCIFIRPSMLPVLCFNTRISVNRCCLPPIYWEAETVPTLWGLSLVYYLLRNILLRRGFAALNDIFMSESKQLV